MLAVVVSVALFVFCVVEWVVWMWRLTDGKED